MADIQLAAHEPFRKRLLPIQHLLPRLEPNEFIFGLLVPEFFGRTNRLIIKFLISGKRRHSRAFRKRFGGLENALLGRDGKYPFRFVIHWHSRSILKSSGVPSMNYSNLKAGAAAACWRGRVSIPLSMSNHRREFFSKAMNLMEGIYEKDNATLRNRGSRGELRS